MSQMRIILDIFESNPLAVIGTTLAIVLITTCVVFLSSKLPGNEDISIGLKREANSTTSSSNPDTKVLNAATFRSFKVIDVKIISHNTKLFRIEIPRDGRGNPRSLGLGIGRHISVKADIDGQKVIRAYTPTSHPKQNDYFELLIKSYEFGKLTPFLHRLNIGDSIEVRGPIGRFNYTPNTYKTMGLIAGGTGITPCLQVMRVILDNVEETTKFVLFYQNRSVNDVLLKETLDELATRHIDRLQIHYFLSNPSEEWGKSSSSNTFEKRGYISANDVKIAMKFGAENAVQYVGLCGPSGFNDSIQALLKEHGQHTDSSIFVW